MKLRALLEGIPVLDATADLDMEITGVSYDSRTTRPGDLFVAMTGFAVDGHDFIPKAVSAGAAAVLCERAPERAFPGCARKTAAGPWPCWAPTSMATPPTP